jgi:hypothetical protein
MKKTKIAAKLFLLYTNKNLACSFVLGFSVIANINKLPAS